MILLERFSTNDTVSDFWVCPNMLKTTFFTTKEFFLPLSHPMITQRNENLLAAVCAIGGEIFFSVSYIFPLPLIAAFMRTESLAA